MNESYLSVVESARAVLDAWHEPVDGSSIADIARHMMRVAECVEVLKLVMMVYDSPPDSEIGAHGLVDDEAA